MSVNDACPLFQFHHVDYMYSSNDDRLNETATTYALRDVSFQIQQGEYVAIVGHNGSGKSTLAKLMTGLLSATAGTVHLQGEPVETYVATGRLPQVVGLVFQDPDSQSVATVVEEDVAFALENLNIPHAEMHERVEAALQRVGMWAYRMREPHLLSGGQKQRVAIASVIAAGPTCLIFDEATSMLDTIGRREIRALMRELAASGHTVITITHHMDEVIDAQRVLVFDKGNLAMDTTPNELFLQEEKVKELHLEVPMQALVARLLRERGLNEDNLGLIAPEEFVARLAKKSVGADINAASDDQIDDIDPPERHTADEPVDIVAKVVEVAHLHHVYMRKTPLETQALSDVSLTIDRGEIAAIVGATGSGKSTLGLYLNGLYQAEPGVVTVLGLDGAAKQSARQLRQRVGMLFQKSEAQIFETLVGDEIAYGPFRFGASVPEARQAVQAAMELVNLDFSWRDRPTFALSGGERRKVATASVLAQNPEILVLDEPTAALDPLARRELIQMLRRLRDERHMTIIFVTHQLEEVVELADKVLVLDHGQLVLAASPAEWLSHPDEVTALGFDLPEAPAYVQSVCRAAHLPLPSPLPLMPAHALVWLGSLCLRDKGGI
ncbi:ABC transporter ATP-binding protein [Alicyclobacillus fodiniaquatilis]|uniref:ABC transporter ATP-binding protein n=1 Tax=Alicyclobacillus fodiniaquatilis TaxID=1661150 RepID=A0ABW4JDE4_9BACL